MILKVYLAGSISGLTYEGATEGWREEFKRLLGEITPPMVKCYSPMRAEEHLIGKGPISPKAYTGDPWSVARSIVIRDRNDVRTCDVMVACFLESGGRISLGTGLEFGWADAWQKPIIMIAAEDDPHRQHPMLAPTAGYVTDNLQEAATLTRNILLP